MNRLKRRLERYAVPPQQPEYPPNYQPDYQPDYPEEQQPQPQPQPQSQLVQEYDRLQQRAKEYQREIAAIEANNPHTLHKDVILKPTSKGKLPVTVMGRPVDLAMLENYVIHKISPKTITTLMRYNDVKAIEDVKGYSKRPPLKLKGSLIWIILGAIAILIVGYILMSTDVTSMMKNIFGM